MQKRWLECLSAILVSKHNTLKDTSMANVTHQQPDHIVTCSSVKMLMHKLCNYVYQISSLD